MGHRKQVLHLAKVGAAMLFVPHPYIVAHLLVLLIICIIGLDTYWDILNSFMCNITDIIEYLANFSQKNLRKF